MAKSLDECASNITRFSKEYQDYKIKADHAYSELEWWREEQKAALREAENRRREPRS